MLQLSMLKGNPPSSELRNQVIQVFIIPTHHLLLTTPNLVYGFVIWHTKYYLRSLIVPELWIPNFILDILIELIQIKSACKALTNSPGLDRNTQSLDFLGGYFFLGCYSYVFSNYTYSCFQVRVIALWFLKN
jgi:hypothetical protein